jgi:YggT family protein
VSLVREIVFIALYLLFFLLLARFVLDWVMYFARSYRPSGPMLLVFEVVYSGTDPILKPLRRLIPPLRLGGGVALDLTLLIALLGVQILLYLVAP